MKSLFLRMFLSFCAGTAIVTCVMLIGFGLSNPDQLPFAWPRVGRGAILSAARMAVAAFERGGSAELNAYLDSLHQDTGIRGALFDGSKHPLSIGLGMYVPDELASQNDERLLVRIREHLSAVRLRGAKGAPYAFVAGVPRREGNLFWSRTFVLSFVLTGAFLCYLFARHVTAPVVMLRAAASRFSGGDLRARISSPRVLERSDEIGGLARDFNEMAARIESLMKAQQRLIADVSHELRSPITRLGLALGLMRRRNDPENQQSLARIEREVERLNALISQLLMLSRLEFLEQRPAMETVDLCGLLREIASDADFEAAGADRSVRLLECAPCPVRGARDLIRSAVENVVRNAVKYTAVNTQVTIALERTANGLAIIRVSDQGPGVPPEALAHMFEPFYRADEARDRQSGGFGLGLAIAKQIVALHGGSIEAANRPGGGLEMRITLRTE